MRNCNWKCGRKTQNHTRICDLCWADRENIYLARKAKEAAEDKKPLSEPRETALAKARRIRAAKLLKELPGRGLSH
jgi:predicted amidophosphoribosyltransferase